MLHKYAWAINSMSELMFRENLFSLAACQLLVECACADKSCTNFEPNWWSIQYIIEDYKQKKRMPLLCVFSINYPILIAGTPPIWAQGKVHPRVPLDAGTSTRCLHHPPSPHPPMKNPIWIPACVALIHQMHKFKKTSSFSTIRHKNVTHESILASCCISTSSDTMQCIV